MALGASSKSYGTLLQEAEGNPKSKGPILAQSRAVHLKFQLSPSITRVACFLLSAFLLIREPKTKKGKTVLLGDLEDPPKPSKP